MTETEYILGDADEEIRRLRLQHDVWRGETLDLLKMAKFCSGQTLLDIGCGPGFATWDLLDIVGAQGRVVAVDSSAKMIEALDKEVEARELTNVSGILLDIDELAAQVEEVDGAFARWIFCFLDDPKAAVLQVAKTLKTGGRFVVMDYFNYESMTVQPQSALFDKVYRAVFESFRNPGGGLDVGRHIPGILRSAGFEVETITPICKISVPGSNTWDWLAEFQKTYFPDLVKRGFLSAAELSDFTDYWAEISRSSDTFVFGPPMLGIVGTKR